VQVVRSELEVPAQLTGLQVERENAVRIKIIALAFAAIGIGIRVAGGPVEGVGIRVVTAGEPGGTATEFLGTVQNRQASWPVAA